MFIFVTLLNIAIFQGFILGLIILNSPFFKSKANAYLAFTIFTLSLLLLNLVLEIVGAYNVVPFVQVLDGVEWVFLLPVLFLWYIVYQVDHSFKTSPKKLWFLVPFGYSLIINILSFFISGGSEEILFSVLSQIEFFLLLVFLPLMLLLSYQCIKKAKRAVDKKWLLLLWFFIAVFLFSWVLAVGIAWLFHYDIFLVMRIIALFVALSIQWIAYIGIYKFKLAKDKAAIKKLLKQKNSGVKMGAIGEEEVDLMRTDHFTQENHYYRMLEKLCREDEIYKDYNLDRVKVAQKLNISVGYLSQIINSIRNENFNTYINTYRVEAVKEMLVCKDFQHYSLLAIGIEAGFTSKTTFNKSFKKCTGMTPNEYRKENK